VNRIQWSEAPDDLVIVGWRNGQRFTVTIKVREIVIRTTGEASWRKGCRVAPYHGNIVTRVEEES